jgi:hypothetical protein
MFFIVKKLVKFIKKDKSAYNPQRYYYESLFERYKSLSGYYNLIELLTSKEELKTNEVITLMPGYPFNMKREEVFRNYKNPWTKFRIRKLNLTIDILIYKIFLGGYPAHLEIHVTKDSLFYYKYAFSGDISKEDKQSIIEIIQNKYLDGNSMSIKQTKLWIPLEQYSKLKIA